LLAELSDIHSNDSINLNHLLCSQETSLRQYY